MQDLDAFMENGVREKIFTGAIARVSLNGEKVYEKTVGHEGLGTEKPISSESCFDLASLTKVLATTLVAMRLLEKGLISLEMPLGKILPEWKKRRHEIRIFHLLQHTAGLPAFLEFFRELVHFPLERRVQERRRLLSEVRLLHIPGKETLYSDLGFMLLKEAFVEVAGKPFEKLVFESLPPTAFPDRKLLFFPSDKDRASGYYSFVATSFSVFRGRRLHGEVHDENAAVVNGVDGHAGLFGRAAGVGLVGEALLDAWYGKGEWISPEAIRRFIFWPDSGGRPLGFDRVSGENSSAGCFFSRESIGHLGFTGTSLWMDLSRRLCVVLLTNRVFYGDDNWKIRNFRPEFHNLLVKTLRLIKN